MKVHIQLAVGAFAFPIGLLAACSSETRTETPPVAASFTGTDADNSDRNSKDVPGSVLTAMDQGSSEADLGVTQRVRQTVVDQDGFSVNAKNVKIITQEGVVTLRGPVATAEEKAQIGVITAKADGVKGVNNQLEVESSP